LHAKITARRESRAQEPTSVVRPSRGLAPRIDVFLRKLGWGTPKHAETAAISSKTIERDIGAVAALASDAQPSIASLLSRLNDVGRRLAGLGQEVSTLEKTIACRAAKSARTGAAMATPAVSVIVPTFNRARFVPEAIASVIDQSWTDRELIIVDDGSTDDTAEVVTICCEDPRIRYLRRPHAGQSAARNKALREARGTLIAFLGCDNLFYPDFLAAAVAVLGAEPDLPAICGVLVTAHHHLVGTELLFRPFDRATLIAANHIDLNTLVCRKSSLDRIGGFDESLRKLEDWHLVLRLTEDAPAKPVPVLAARDRMVDAIRISVSHPEEAAIEAIRRKLKLREP